MFSVIFTGFDYLDIYFLYNLDEDDFECLV